MINRSNCNYYNNAIINHVMIKENMILPKTVLRGVETVLMQAIQLFSLQEETQRLMKHSKDFTLGLVYNIRTC